nr:MAG TPA: hypothetical protein [Caudoviricetes sp.]
MLTYLFDRVIINSSSNSATKKVLLLAEYFGEYANSSLLIAYLIMASFYSIE